MLALRQARAHFQENELPEQKILDRKPNQAYI